MSATRPALVFNPNATFTARYPNGDSSTYAAVLVTWTDRDAFLGPNPPAEHECDALLAQALADAGAPAWVARAPLRAVDKTGWYVIGQRMSRSFTM